MTTQAPEVALPEAANTAQARRRSAHWLALVLRDRVARIILLGSIIALMVTFYCWTVDTSGSPIVFNQPLDDYYNQLATAFLHGSLSLLTRPPAALIHLKNPYDPAYNTALAAPFHDLSLYHGRFYLAWGPTAALLLFIPWRIFGVGDMSPSLAIVIMSAVGLLFATMLMVHLVDRFMPTVRLWKLAAATFTLGLASVLPFLGRRPAQYEVAITSGYCFGFLALYFLITGIYTERWKVWRVALGSLCVGLAILGREDYGIYLIVPVLLAVREWRQPERPTRWIVRRAGPLLLPCFIMIAIVLLYNHARFGSFFQFGTRYQLAGIDQENAFNYKLWAIPPGLFYYFVEPVQYSLAFPYFQLGPPPYYPWNLANYSQTELVGGILTESPILLTLFVSPLVFRRRFGRDLRWLMIVSGALGFLIALSIAWGIPGTTQRYEVDFATLLLLPALLVWFALTDKERSPWSSAKHARLYCSIMSGLGAIFLIYGMLVGIGTSITGYYDELRATDRTAYRQLATSTSFIPTLITKLIGHPDITKDTYLCANGECGTYAAGLSHWTLDDNNTVELDVISPSGGWNLAVEMFTTTTEKPGNQLIIQLDNKVWSVYTVRGQRWVAVPMHSGYNRIYYDIPGKVPVSIYRLTTTRSNRGLVGATDPHIPVNPAP